MSETSVSIAGYPKVNHQTDMTYADTYKHPGLEEKKTLSLIWKNWKSIERDESLIPQQFAQESWAKIPEKYKRFIKISNKLCPIFITQQNTLNQKNTLVCSYQMENKFDK